MLEIRLLGQIHCVLVGNSRTTIGLIHVKRSGNGPKLRAGTCAARFSDLLPARPEPVGGVLSTAIYSDLLVLRRPARYGGSDRTTDFLARKTLARLRCVGIQFEGVLRTLKTRDEIGRQCNEFCCMVD
jgi:hypothetical protein